MVLRIPLLTCTVSPPLTVVTPVASDAPLTCPVQTITALQRADLLGRRWYFRLPFLPQLSTSIIGKSSSIGSRGLCNHQESAPKRGNRGTRTPRCSVSRSNYETNGTGLPIIGNKGVLRTIGSKSTFAYFSLTRKAGRRRHDKVAKYRRPPMKKHTLVRG